MDQLSTLYVRMASGQQSQLHNPTAVVSFVDQLQSVIERSSSPRKNFLLDSTNAHGDAVITEASAMKSGIGWVTLHVTEGIRRGLHEWCIKIESQGETTDGSGLMVGIVPKSFTKFDSFISQGGGWCLSRAGKLYGHWRRQDTNAGTITFGTGDRIVFLLDYESARMTVRVGDKCIVGEVSNLGTEVFPAVSLHYRHQHVRFEYHVVHDRNVKRPDWMGRGVIPSAAAFLPLTMPQLDRLTLDSYVFSRIFTDRATEVKKQRASKLQLTRQQRRPPSGPESGGLSEGGAHQGDDAPRDGDEAATPTSDYISVEAASARLVVVRNALTAVQRYISASPPAAKGSFLSAEVTAEYLRHRFYESMRESGGLGIVPGAAAAAARGTAATSPYDATMNCGAVIIIHMFARAVSGAGGAQLGKAATVLPLVRSLSEYILSLPLFSLAESCSSAGAGGQKGVGLAPDVVQLAVDNTVKTVEAVMEAEPESLGDLGAALLELVVLFALQRGLVSETLRACRLLLRFPQGCVSRGLLEWVQLNLNALRPRRDIPDMGRALKRVCEDPHALMATGIDPKLAVLSVGYGNGFIYVHTSEGLRKWGASGPRFVLVHETHEPQSLCPGALRSSIATTFTHLLLLTDCMHAEGVAVVSYTITLEVHRVFKLEEMGATWPRDSRACPLLTSGPDDQVILVYEHHAHHTSVAAPVNGAAAASATTAAAMIRSSTSGFSTSSPAAAPASTSSTRRPPEVKVQGFSFPSFPQPVWTSTLAAPSAGDFTLSHCLALRRPCCVDLGSPDDLLQVAGGHVTVEMWILLLDKEDTATLYQHGDRTTSGEVFIETTRLEGAFSVRGGYRHDVRGSCVVSAPLPPVAEARFYHIALIFDGRWHLFFEGEEVAGNRQGPHVSLEAPKQRWTVGANCTCLLAGLRVWTLGRSAREVARDFTRPLIGDEPGLVSQMFFNEYGGNVTFNYATNTRAKHAVCIGAFSHTRCDHNPWKQTSAGPPPVVSPLRAPLHDWRDLTLSTCFSTGTQLTLLAHVGEGAPFALKGGRVMAFFDLRSGTSHPALFYLTNKSSARGSFGCDGAGRIWELFDMDPEMTGASSTLFTGALTRRERGISVASLPLDGADEEEQGIAGLGVQYLSTQLPTTAVPATSTSEAEAEAEEEQPPNPFITGRMPSVRQDAALAAAATPMKLTYGSLATWLLQLLSMYAAEDSAKHQNLFSPLADDVGRRTCAEVKATLQEHFRVVKGPGARRAVALKCGHSKTVLLAALQVLLRLIRRVKAFGLHPSSVGLNVLAADAHDDLSGLVREFYASSPRWRSSGPGPGRRGSGRSSSGGHAGGGGTGAFIATATGVSASAAALPATTGETLLAALGDVINEAGVTLPRSLGRLARTALIEGIALFIPAVPCRAKLLCDVLSSSATGTSASPISAANDSAGSEPGAACAAERVPALEVLLDAVVGSFCNIHSAAPLLFPEAVAAAGTATSTAVPLSSNSSTASPEALAELRQTLDAIIDESVAQLRQHAATPTAATAALSPLTITRTSSPSSSSFPSATATKGAVGARAAESSLMSSLVSNTPASARQCRVMASLADATSTLQLLLLSTCSNKGGGTPAEGVTPPVKLGAAFSPPPATTHHAVVRHYYAVLFKAAREAIYLVLARHDPAGDTGGVCNSAFSAQAPLLELLRHSFVGTPLHTAITAIPLVLTVEDASWFLSELEGLLPLAGALRDKFRSSAGSSTLACISGGSPVEAPRPEVLAAADATCPALYDAVLFGCMWVSVFMFQATSIHTSTTVANAEEASSSGSAVIAEGQGKLSAEVQEICDSPLLASGVRAWDLEGPKAKKAGTQSAGTGGDTTATGTHSRSCGARLSLLRDLYSRHKQQWMEAQQRFDALSQRTTPELANAISLMALTAVYLSNTASLGKLKRGALDALLVSTMRRMLPVRNQLLQQRQQQVPHASTSASLSESVREVERRCELLLCAVSPFETPTTDDALFSSDAMAAAARAELNDGLESSLVLSICGEGGSGGGGGATTQRSLPPKSSHMSAAVPRWENGKAGEGQCPRDRGASARWRWAIARVRRQLLLRRAEVVSDPALNLTCAVEFVSHVMTSEVASAKVLRGALEDRDALAALRVRGLRQLLRILRREPRSSESIVLLISGHMSGMDETPDRQRRHFEAGIGGSSSEVLCRVRACMCGVLEWLRVHQHASVGSPAAGVGDTGPQNPSQAGGAHPPRLPGEVASAAASSSRAVLCEMLNRTWAPRELCYLDHIGAINDVFMQCCSLFEPATPAATFSADGWQLLEESAAERKHREAADKHRVRLRTSGSAGDGAGLGDAVSPRHGNHDSGKGDDEEAENAVMRTGREWTLRQALGCLKSVGVQCAVALRKQQRMPCAQRVACTGFLHGYMDMIGQELGRCWTVVEAPPAPPAVSATSAAIVMARVKEQVATLCSLIAAVLAPLASATDEVCFPEELSRCCGRLARILCALAQWYLRDTEVAAEAVMNVGADGRGGGVSAASVCLRVAVASLRHCNPTVAAPEFISPAFTTAPRGGVEAALAARYEKIERWLSSPEAAVAPSDSTGTPLGYLVSFTTRCLSTTGLSDITLHAVEGVRSLLLVPRWAEQLPLVKERFCEDVKLFAYDVVTDAPETRLPRWYYSVRMLAWMAVLGGALPHLPCSGLRARCNGEQQSTSSSVLEGVVVELTSQSPGGSGGAAHGAAAGGVTVTMVPLERAVGCEAEGDDKGEVAATRKHGAVPTIMNVEKPISEDTVFMPTPAASLQLPRYRSLEADFIRPMIRRCFVELAATPAYSLLTALEVGVVTSLLTLVQQLVRDRPVDCAAMVEAQAMLAVSRFAMATVARAPLSMLYTREYCAYALRLSLARMITQGGPTVMLSVRTAPGATTVNSPVTALGRKQPQTQQQQQQSPLSSGVMSFTGLGSVSSPTYGSYVRAPSQAPTGPSSASPYTAMRTDRGISGPGTTSIPNVGGSGSPGVPVSSTVATMMAGGGGGHDYSLAHVRGGGAHTTISVPPSSSSAARKAVSNNTAPPATLCLYAQRTPLPACVVITPTAAVAGAPSPTTPPQTLCSFPTWADGVAVEVSLLLCDRLFPELGEDFSVPQCWERPGIHLSLLSLHAGGDRPCLQVCIHEGQLVATVQAPPPQSSLGSGEEGDGAKEPSSAPAAAECTLPLVFDDWDRFIHVAIIVEKNTVTLVKSGEWTSAPLAPLLAERLQQRLALPRGATRLVLGTELDAGWQQRQVDSDGGAIQDSVVAEEHTMVLVSSIRMWGSAALKASVKAVAELVARDQMLPTDPAADGFCFFQFTECTGDTVRSAFTSDIGNMSSNSHTYIGKLLGAVRWASCPFQPGCPLVLDRSGRLNAGTSAEIPCLLPRAELLAFFAGLDAQGLEQYSRDSLWTFAAHLSRQTTEEALRQCLSPGYAFCSAPRPTAASMARARLHPLAILEKRDVLWQLCNLFRYCDAGVITRARARLVQDLVARVLEVRREAGEEGANELSGFFAETAQWLPEALREETETFTVAVPPSSSYSGTAGHGTAKEGAAPPFLLALINGGHGTLSFNLSGRVVEQATIFKDRACKSVLAKYPDGQGGWPDCAVQPDVLWLFVRLTGAPRAAISAMPGITAAAFHVTIKSLRPAVARAFMAAVCRALYRDDFARGRPLFLNARLISLLIQQGSGGGEGAGSVTEDFKHAVPVLTSLLKLWTAFPRTQPYDHIPLQVVLAHINVPLVGLLQRGTAAPESLRLLSPSCGTYNAYLQALFALLMAAVRLEGAWRCRTHQVRVRARWLRLIALWKDGATVTEGASHGPAVRTATAGALSHLSPMPDAVLATTRSDPQSPGPQATLTPPSQIPETAPEPVSLEVLTPVQLPNCPVALVSRKGSGEWNVRCDRGCVTTRAAVGFTRGRFYFEVRVPGHNSALAVGVVTSKTCAFELGDAIGQDGESWGFDSAQLCRFHNGYRNDLTSRTKWKAGDVIGVLMDLQQNRLICLHNDRQVGVFEKFRPPSLSGAALFPAVTCGAAGCDINLGAMPFVLNLPIGYLPVDPSYYYSSEVGRVWFTAAATEWGMALDVSAPQDCSLLEQLVGRAPDLAIQHTNVLSNASLGTAQRHVLSYCAGRDGPLSVDLLCTHPRARVGGNDARADDVPCTVRGTVCVSGGGKWYYEVVARDDAGMSVGWISANVDGELGPGKSLGDDENSWALEGRRMMARHNRHQISLGRHQWRAGDVVGCLLDCHAGTMRYTINGILQREVHDTDGDGVLFRNVDIGNAGLVPAVGLEAKAAATFMWDAEDLLFLPDGYKPLGAASAILAGITEYVLQPHPQSNTDTGRGRKEVAGSGGGGDRASGDGGCRESERAMAHRGSIPSTSTSLHTLYDSSSGLITPAMLTRLLTYIGKTVNLNPFRVAAYCLHSTVFVTITTTKNSGGAAGEATMVTQSLMNSASQLYASDNDTEAAAAMLNMSPSLVRRILALLHTLSSAVEQLHALGHAGTLPCDVEGDEGFDPSPLQAALRTLRQYSLPFMGLRVLRRFLLSSTNISSSSENLKLSVNRRKALALMQEPPPDGQQSPSATIPSRSAPTVAARLQDSLFGQIYSLLAHRGPGFFCTSKRLWSIAFIGEGANDVGGPYRESISQMCSELMSSVLPLFIPSPNQTGEIGECREVFVLNPTPPSPIVLGMYEFTGHLIGGCLRSSEPLSLYLPSSVWKALVGVPAGVDDLERTDLATVQALRYLTQLTEGNSAAADEELRELCSGGFTVQDDAGVDRELFPGGASISVTHKNVGTYVQLALEYKLRRMAAAPLKALVDGFHHVVPLCAVSGLHWRELEELVCGQRDYDPDALLDAAYYENLSPDDSRVRYLRETLRGFTRHHRALFMRFVTGRERLPTGMRLRIISDDSPQEVQRMSGSAPIAPQPPASGTSTSSSSVLRRPEAGVRVPSAPPRQSPVEEAEVLHNDERLPHASTCFYWLSLPRYSSAAALRAKLLFAIEQCMDIDADFRVHDGDMVRQSDEPTVAHMSQEDAGEFEDFSHLR